MKKILKQIGLFIALILIFLAVIPFYLQQSLLHLFPDLDDAEIFFNNKVNISSPSKWEESPLYNQKKLKKESLEYLERLETTAFLVIQNEQIIHESYWDGYEQETLSNMFSVTKSIVSILIGIAIDEGHINSIYDPIGKYIPELQNDVRGRIMLIDLLTMSSALEWNENYTKAFSTTTKAYYGNNLRELVTRRLLEANNTPGKVFSYKSGDTQLLSFVLEAATGSTISEYASQKLWKKICAEEHALWSKDAKNGDERAFCCFHATARDIARIGQLVLNKGKWNNEQVVSASYLEQATQPASQLIDETGKQLDHYGYQWWITHTAGYQIPYMRGYKGQYIYVLPEKNAIIVRLGNKKDSQKIGPITADVWEYVKIGLELIP